MVEFAAVDVDWAEAWRRRDEKRRDRKTHARTGAGLIVGGGGEEAEAKEDPRRARQVSRHGDDGSLQQVYFASRERCSLSGLRSNMIGYQRHVQYPSGHRGALKYVASTRSRFLDLRRHAEFHHPCGNVRMTKLKHHRLISNVASLPRICHQSHVQEYPPWDIQV